MKQPFKTITVDDGEPMKLDEICWPVNGELCCYYHDEHNMQKMCFIPDCIFWLNDVIKVQQTLKQTWEFSK